MTRVCAVDGCHRETRTGGADLCNAHYFRKYRNGTVGPADIRPRRDGCDVGGCVNSHTGRGLCAMHLARFDRHGDVHHVGKPRPLLGPLNQRWIGDEVGYVGAHDRVRARRGRAAEHPCFMCGGSAAHWAYDRAAPDEKQDPKGPYSPTPDHYMALCVPCHKRFDLNHLSRVS